MGPARKLLIAGMSAAWLMTQAGQALACKPWEEEAPGYDPPVCVDRPGVSRFDSTYTPADDQQCWQDIQLNCLCQPGQSPSYGTCSPCQYQSEQVTGVVCVPRL